MGIEVERVKPRVSTSTTLEVAIMSNLDLTSGEINRLRLSFFELIPVSEQLSQAFYARLFAKHPEVRANFTSDILAQQEKLVDTLATLLDTLDRTDEAVGILRSLGRRHVGYGATPELYAYVEVTFLELLSQYASPQDRSELEELWSRLMKFVSETMLSGANIELSPC
ncbi:MAG: globin domain-containing protein [Armatimonadota bacterium]